MALHRLVVRLRSNTNLPEDDVVNVHHFRHSLGGLLEADHNDFCENLCHAYVDNLGTILGGVNVVTATSYDVGPAPNYPLGSYQLGAAGLENQCGPREVALCLSFFATRNLPRSRGRVYVGPMRDTVCAERPTVTTMNALLTFGQALKDCGGTDWAWVAFSRVSGEDEDVSDIWVDNAWDTQRRRGNPPSSRVTAQV